MSPKILIHWHPQFSYFHRAFIDAALSLDVRQEDIVADVIVGANFLSHLDTISFEFLDSLRKLQYRGLRIGRIFCVPETISGNKLSSNLQGQKKFKYQFSEKAVKLFHNAVEDNLARSLLRDFDGFRFRVDQDYQDQCIHNHRAYACDLIDYYNSIIEHSNYSLVVISHGNYVYYVNLYLAAYFHGIETLVIHGGHGHSYLAKTDRINDLCPSNMYDELCTLCSPQQWDDLRLPEEISIDAQQQLISFVKGSGGGSLASLFKENLDKFKWNGNSRVIMGLVPILMEFQHRNCLMFMNANSKSDWIEQLVKFGSRNNEEIIFYLHPDIAAGTPEKELQVRLIEYFSMKYSQPCRIVSSRHEARQILADRPVIASSPSGTIASELAALGSTSLISNYCTPARVLGGTLVVDNFTTSQDIVASLQLEYSSLKVDQSAVTSEQLINVIRLFKAIGKYNSKTLLLHTAMDKVFFFGQSTTSLDISSTLSLIEAAYLQARRGTIHTNSFRAFYSY